MKDSLTSSNFEDFRKRYEGTYGNYSHKLDKPIMVRLDTVQEGQVNFIDAKGGTYHTYADAGIPFEFYPVERRVANTPTGNVLYCTRKTATQWRRGVCDNNTSVVNLVTNRTQAVNFATLACLYEPNKAYDKALQVYLKREREGIALSDKFCLLRDVVMLYNIPIGRFNIEEKTATVHSMFNQEFRDLVNRNNFPIKVELLNVK